MVGSLRSFSFSNIMKFHIFNYQIKIAVNEMKIDLLQCKFWSEKLQSNWTSAFEPERQHMNCICRSLTDSAESDAIVPALVWKLLLLCCKICSYAFQLVKTCRFLDSSLVKIRQEEVSPNLNRLRYMYFHISFFIWILKILKFEWRRLKKSVNVFF